MLGQQTQSEISPENLVINVIQENIEKISRGKKQEHTTATRLKLSLIRMQNAIKSGKNDVQLYLETSIRGTENLLDIYLKDVNDLHGRIEITKNKAQIEQLKFLRKVEWLLQAVERALAIINEVSLLSGKYPLEIKSGSDLTDMKYIFKNIGDLPEDFEKFFSSEKWMIRKEEARDLGVTSDQKALRPLKLYLIPKIKDEERRAAEQRIYFMDEKGLEDHLKMLMKNFTAERDKIVNILQQQYSRLSQQTVPTTVPIHEMQNSVILRNMTTQGFSLLSQTIFEFVHDVKNLLEIYKDHFKSTVNLNIDLDVEEADKLRELESIADIVEKLPDAEYLRGIKTRLKELNEIRSKFLVYAKYDYLRDEFIDKEALKEYQNLRKTVSDYIKSKASKNYKKVGLQQEQMQFKTGAKSSVYRFMITVPGVSGRIRGDIFLKDPNHVPEKAVICITGYMAYRQLYTNMFHFIAEDGYLVLSHDLPSQGESRGRYGFAESSENVLILAKYLQEKYGVKEIALIGHSLGGLVALFALMHYDMESDNAVRAVSKKFAQFWSDLSLNPRNSPKSLMDAINSKFDSFKSESKEKLASAIINSYNRWNPPFRMVALLNSPLIEMKDLFDPLFHKKFALYLYHRKLNFFNLLAKVANGFVDPERVQEKAFNRLKRMKKSDPEEFKRLEALNPIFKKGFSVFDKDHFFRECSYGITPLHYLINIEESFPGALASIRGVPKIFMYTTGDKLAGHTKNNEALAECFQHFGNCKHTLLSGLKHDLTYNPDDLKGRLFGTPDKRRLLTPETPTDSAFLNHLHNMFKYNL